jgi:hypothetical protein
MKNSTRLWNIYGFEVFTSLLIVALVGWRSGAASIVSVMILAGIEISFSFENAVINAKILQHMSLLWQKLFMTVGIAVAVFGVRFLLPLLMVSVTGHIAFNQVIDMALYHPNEYADKLTHAHPVIAAFGGMFLLMIFLDFIFETRPVMWLAPIERRLAVFGKLESLSVIVALGALLFAVNVLAPQGENSSVLLAGVVGILIYLVINTLESLRRIEPDGVPVRETGGHSHIVPKRLLKGGIVGFFYLEMIDASFSLDGVIGAFAITNKVLLIAAGLAIGALFVRAMTIHMLRRGTLKKYRYLDHGAHYAIGLLAVLLLISVRYVLPDAVTGLSGVAIISLALIDSYLESKRENQPVAVV